MNTHTDNEELAKTERIILDIMQTQSTYDPAVFPSDEHFTAARIARHVHQYFDLKSDTDTNVGVTTKSSGELEEILEGLIYGLTGRVTAYRLDNPPPEINSVEEAINAIDYLYTTQTTKLQNQRLEDFLRWHNHRVDTFTIGFDLLNEFYDQLEREHKVRSDA